MDSDSNQHRVTGNVTTFSINENSPKCRGILKSDLKIDDFGELDMFYLKNVQCDINEAEL